MGILIVDFFQHSALCYSDCVWIEIKDFPKLPNFFRFSSRSGTRESARTFSFHWENENVKNAKMWKSAKIFYDSWLNLRQLFCLQFT